MPAFKAPRPRVEPSPRWVRVKAGDVEIANSRRALLLSRYGPGMLPTYCFPAEDVRTDLLSPSGRDHDGGEIAHDVVVGDLVVAGGATLFSDPPPRLKSLAGHWTFAWDTGLTWLEEALEVNVHARDTNKRVDVLPSERHVTVEIDGVVVADTRRPHALFETSLPTRWYLPMEDVRRDLLVPSDTVTRCPYKGKATYWSAQIGDRLHRDVAWTYREPVVECPRIKGLVCFFNERVDLTVDGELWTRPRTPWS